LLDIAGFEFDAPHAEEKIMSRARTSFESLEVRRLLAFVVNTTLDETDVNDTTSLREAIALATANVGDDHITFDNSVFAAPGFYQLTLSLGELSYISSSGTLFIDAPSAPTIAVSGDGLSRVFNFGASASVEITNLVIRDGYDASQGGGIFNAGDLVLNNCSVAENIVAPTTAGEGAQGGGIYNSGSLTVNTGSFESNSAVGAHATDIEGTGGSAEGGGIYSSGALTIDNDVTFGINTVIAGDGAYNAGEAGGRGGDAKGGAIFLESDPSADINDAFFSFNEARGGAGGDADTGFSAGDGGEGVGGAIASSSQDIDVDDSTFNSNTAAGGGGGSGDDPGNGGTSRGGAIFTAGDMNLTDSDFDNNLSEGGDSEAEGGPAYGGAIVNEDQLQVTFVDLIDNNAFGGDGGNFLGGNGWGGGLANTQGEATVTDSYIFNNKAVGGLSTESGGGGGTGGGVYSPATLDITFTTIRENVAIGGDGGISPGLNGSGGGIASGGGVYGDFNPVFIANSTISYNSAIGGTGGSGFAITGGSGGMALGGGILNDTELTLHNSTIYGNTTTGGTGGDGAIGGNSGASGGGGINNLPLGTIDALNCTVAENDALAGIAGATGGTVLDSEGGGIKTSVIISLTNTIVADNFADVGEDLRGSYVLLNCLVSASPLFYDVEPGSFNNHLTTPALLGPLQDNGGPTETALPGELSEAINNGNNAAALAEFGAGGFDQRGEGFPRFVGVVDIGAVEVPGEPIRINFQPESAPLAGGFLGDFGKVFADRGNGFDYGWNQSATSFTRDRNILSDQAKDTLVHMQLYGNRTWEISLPNGAYEVHLVAGDAQYFNSVYKINVEGVLTVNGTPTNGNRFIEGTQTVVVSDGKLTITNAAGSSNNKLNFIEITPTDVLPVKINFQPNASALPPGYLKDSGSIFGDRGNGETYGWNLSASSFTRDRNAGLSPDQRYDTLVHTQLYGNRTWELEVPNGTYSVFLVAGDPSFFNSVYKFNLEGSLALSGTPTSGNRWIEATKVVSVSDGRLTLTNAAGSSNNKITFIEVTPL
jgi:hypothetical protein